MQESKRLGMYAVMAGSFLAHTEVDAAIVYTDVDPDATIVNGIFDVDFNGDGLAEFRLSQSGISFGSFVTDKVSIEPWIGGGSGWVPDAFYSTNPRPLFSGFSIGSAGPWDSYYLAYLGIGIVGISIGPWGGLTDRYLGVRMNFGGATHYGWIRLDVNAGYTAFRIKDFAYESSPGVPIAAGDMSIPVTVDSALAPVATDIGNSANGLDLEIAFNRAPDEAGISEYRAIAVKSADAASFDLAAAEFVVPANYLAINPTGSDITAVFNAASTDRDGDLIAEGVPYRVFILSVADGVLAGINNISEQSNEITLENLPPAGIALNVSAIDNSDFGDGRDLFVSFDAASDESGIAEYRMIAVKSADAASFSLTDAMALGIDQYKVITPSGFSNSSPMNSTTQDSDGDLITTGVPYQVFVHSVADGVNALVDNLSSPSNEVTLDGVTGLDVTANETKLWAADGVLFWSNISSVSMIRLTDLSGRVFLEAQVGTNSFVIPEQAVSGIIFAELLDERGLSLAARKIRIE